MEGIHTAYSFLLDFFYLVQVAEFSALKFLFILQNFFSIITSYYKLILLKYTEKDLTPATSKMNVFVTNVQLLIVVSKTLCYML